MAAQRKYKKHRVVITVEVEEPLTRSAVRDYVIEAVSEMHGSHPDRYSPYLTQKESEADEVMCSEIVKITIGCLTWDKS